MPAIRYIKRGADFSELKSRPQPGSYRTMQFSYAEFFDNVQKHLPPCNSICVWEVHSEKRIGLFNFSDRMQRMDLSSPASESTPPSQPGSGPPNSATTLGTKRRRSEAEIQQSLGNCYFTNFLDNFSTKETAQLTQVYHSTGGKLPSRRGLKALADSTGIMQSRIKRWYEKEKEPPLMHFGKVPLDSEREEPAEQQLAAQQPAMLTDALIEMMDEVENNLEQVIGINGQINDMVMRMLGE